jgi:hypothetical protein
MIHIYLYFVSIGLPNPRPKLRHSVRNLFCYVIFIFYILLFYASSRRARDSLQWRVSDSNLDLLLRVLAARPLYVRVPESDLNMPDS